MKGEERMDGKENFKKMLQDMIGESMAMDMDEAGKQLARATRVIIRHSLTKDSVRHRHSTLRTYF